MNVNQLEPVALPKVDFGRSEDAGYFSESAVTARVEHLKKLFFEYTGEWGRTLAHDHARIQRLRRQLEDLQDLFGEQIRGLAQELECAEAAGDENKQTMLGDRLDDLDGWFNEFPITC